MKTQIQLFTLSIFRGMGQVMLQNNALSGLLFLAGIFFNSEVMAVGAILGNLSGTIVAVLLKYPKKEIENGWYGFNGALVGIAIWSFFDCNLFSTLTLVIAAGFSSLLMYQASKIIPAFTSPFIVTTWISITALLYFIPERQVFEDFKSSGLDFFSALSNGFGQVMFQENNLTGVFFLVAILVNSRISATYALFGSISGIFLAMAFSVPSSMINSGIFGYNAVLCGVLFADKKASSFVLACAAFLFSFLLLLAFLELNLIALTAPFVIASWLTLFIKHKSGLIP